MAKRLVPRVAVLGVHKVEVPEQQVNQAIADRIGETFSPAKRQQYIDLLREELRGVVLIEVLIRDVPKRRNMNDCNFGQPGSDQGPWLLAYLSPTGDTEIGRDAVPPPRSNTYRIAFFLHFFSPAKPLVTDFGEVPCPPVAPMPERLAKLMRYYPVD